MLTVSNAGALHGCGPSLSSVGCSVNSWGAQHNFVRASLPTKIWGNVPLEIRPVRNTLVMGTGLKGKAEGEKGSG